ncbi:hypothetical protein [Curtobacterium sp. L1-20]|uniref:hypothetical protein n=1 Tax=Curtobacterium sp. L1-20 TaxID=3138181 RepID=UPI003B51CA65
MHRGINRVGEGVAGIGFAGDTRRRLDVCLSSRPHLIEGTRMPVAATKSAPATQSALDANSRDAGSLSTERDAASSWPVQLGSSEFTVLAGGTIIAVALVALVLTVWVRFGG